LELSSEPPQEYLYGLSEKKNNKGAEQSQQKTPHPPNFLFRKVFKDHPKYGILISSGNGKHEVVQ
jgi:hypothetical protein